MVSKDGGAPASLSAEKGRFPLSVRRGNSKHRLQNINVGALVSTGCDD
jgi:hypothetical protein